MSAVVAQMRRAVGEDGANVTLARNLLAPIASQLSGVGDLHCRCVLFDCAPPRIEDVCAALAPPSGGGAIEAVALSEYLGAAAVVFRTAVGAESALRSPARGSCHAVVLPLELGAEMPVVIRPTDVKIMSDSRIPERGSPECGTPAACPPPEGVAWIEIRDDPSVSGEANGGPVVLPPRGTKRLFRDMIADDKRGTRMEEHGEQIRGVRRIDPPPPEKRRAAVSDTAICFEPF